LAYSFPPDVEVGGQRPARFCRYLPQFGVEPIVLSIDERYYAALDRSFVPSESLSLQRTSMFRNPLSLYGAMKAGFKSRNSAPATVVPELDAQISKARSIGIRDHAIACFQIPDGYWGWYWPAMRRASEIIRSGRISAILSTSPPVTAHLIARSLKLRFGIPWIADFRDPWRDSRSAELVPRWHLRLSEKIKRRTLASADCILCNTDRLRSKMITEFPILPENRFVTLTNGFDGEMGLARTPVGSSTLTFLHLGMLYGDRRIDGLARAVKRVWDEQCSQHRVKFVFLGGEEAGSREQVMRFAPDLLENGAIEFRPRVPRSELRGILAAADVLLLVQGNYELQIPAKFYEYLQTGLPMLAITKPGALSDMIQSTGSGVCADPEDAEAISAAILRVSDMRVKSPTEVARQFGRYHYRELTARLVEIIHDVSAASTQDGHLEGSEEVSGNEYTPTRRDMGKK
jgi:glycosyltransferase involved in cell wall biosynthesis